MTLINITNNKFLISLFLISITFSGSFITVKRNITATIIDIIKRAKTTYIITLLPSPKNL